MRRRTVAGKKINRKYILTGLTEETNQNIVNYQNSVKDKYGIHISKTDVINMAVKNLPMLNLLEN